MGPHGIHHVTCISGDAQENLDFYAGVLGMRLVKRSVNQDVPDTYHLFYADAEGHPGSDLTFFPWPQMRPGRRGAGLAVEVALAVPADALGWWAERLGRYGVAVGAPETRFGERALTFEDPHGLAIALVGTDEPRLFAPWSGGPVPHERQVRGIHGMRVRERDPGDTGAFLRSVLGFEEVASDDGWTRFGAPRRAPGATENEGHGGSGGWLDVAAAPDGRLGAWGTGAVHHVAWRVDDVDEELALRERLEAARVSPTDVIDRFWFRSVYFREPGGVLFELATDGPGFGVDEDMAKLGESLILPPWLEQYRDRIEAALPPLETAHAERFAAPPAGAP